MEKIKDKKKSHLNGESEPSATATNTDPPVSKKSKKNKQEKVIESIVNMGYPEADVIRALRAAFNNSERAIQYLVDGIPKSPSTPEGDTSYTSDSTDISPYEFLRTNPIFRRLRQSIWHNPQFLQEAINRMGEMKPEIMRYMNENHEEFLKMLFEMSDDEGEEDEEEDNDQENGVDADKE